MVVKANGPWMPSQMFRAGKQSLGVLWCRASKLLVLKELLGYTRMEGSS